MSEIEVGTVVDYFAHVEVVAIEVTGDAINTGDALHILGHTTDINFTVGSMQLEHQAITRATRGQVVGIKCAERARKHDRVYKTQA
jgi:putative protease